MKPSDGRIYHEHVHICGDCSQEYTAFWIYELQNHKVLDCPCSGYCQECTEKAEQAKPMFTDGWKGDAA